MDLKRDRFEVKGTVTKLLGHTGVKTRARARVGFMDGKGKMWEALWVNLAGINNFYVWNEELSVSTVWNIVTRLIRGGQEHRSRRKTRCQGSNSC